MTSDLIQKRLAERTLRLAEVRQRSALKATAEAALKAYGAGQVEQAKIALDKVLEIDPEQAEGIVLKAIMTLDQQNHKEAILLFEKAAQLSPDSPVVYYNQGNAFRETDQLEKATDSYLKTIELAPGFPDAYGNLGLTYMLLSDYDKANQFLTKAIALDPKNIHALNNMGNLRRHIGSPEQALTFYQRVIEIKPDYALGYNNLGNAYRDLGQLDDAMAAFETAIEKGPQLSEAHYNLGLAHLLIGDFPRGWEGYRWRHKIPGGPAAADHLRKPRWDGSPFKDKTLYLYPEQGLGDVIQFSRFIPLVGAMGGRIILRTPPSLSDVFSELHGVDQFNLESEPEPLDFDIHASLMDLPRLLKIDADTIPGQCPYLHVGANAVKKASRQLGKKKGVRIGFVWAGQPKHDNDRNRSVEPEEFKPLSEETGVELFSLQMGKERQLESVFGPSVTDLAPQIKTWSDTAAFMKNMDLIISVDTSVAHMAGALGCDVWTLLPFMPDWRWQLERTDSPWYPTMRLFRQPQFGDWESVFDEVLTAVRKQIRTP